MVLLWNRKMMTETPGEGGSPGPISNADTVYENAGIEQQTIHGYAGHITTGHSSLTLNLTNYLSDFNAVTGSALYRISEKESKGVENLANGKPRYYPATYVEAMKETAAEKEPDEPVDPDLGSDPAQ